MGDERKEKFSDIAERRIKSLKREQVLRGWLHGEGELTDGEQDISKKFYGFNAGRFSRRAIALHRKSQFIRGVSNPEPFDETEEELTQKFGDTEFGRIAARQALRIHREGRIHRWLTGDENEDLGL